jgi:hypothetical protein
MNIGVENSFITQETLLNTGLQLLLHMAVTQNDWILPVKSSTEYQLH